MASHETDDLIRVEPEEEQDSDTYDGPEPSNASTNDFHVRTHSTDTEDGLSQLPVWLRESSSSFHWRWVPLPIRTFFRAADDWSRGPKPPQIQSITPLFPSVQEVPLRLVDRFLPKRRNKAAALGLVYIAWLLTFTLVIRHSADSGQIEGYGKPESIWCGASLWNGGNGCGLDGNNCRPFTNSSMAFRCNANCKNMIISNPRAVGTTEVLYKPFVVGGPSNLTSSTAPPIYRGDSFICQAAVHAGIVSNDAGGCGVLKLTGPHNDFPASTRHGISSVGFDSLFPKSFTFNTSVSPHCGAVDLRWPLLGVTVFFTTVISLFVSSPSIFFASIFTMLFFHVGMVSDKPNLSSYTALFSLMIGRFLPSALAAYVIYLSSIRRTLTSLTAQLEKTILWLGAAWFGALSNYTLDFIPIQRLTPSDLAQPGAVLSLILIVLLIALIAVGQIIHFRREARLRTYLCIYALLVSALLVGVALPSLSLRIHHYILALLLLPGTAMQTRPALLYQGLLLGLFVNGLARWGFDSVLQTARELAGSGPTESLLPNVTAAVAVAAGGISFSWGRPPARFDGLSVLVNDVERHRWYVGEGAPAWTWGGGNEEGKAVDEGVEARAERRNRDYFRFAFMDGSGAADYTKAGVWEVNGTWRGMEPGPS